MEAPGGGRAQQENGGDHSRAVAATQVSDVGASSAAYRNLIERLGYVDGFLARWKRP